ncbi:MAG: hypothetical protein OEW58_08290 [Gammaproteobacteria bacterium]|nr:hypothetical protein [Gammaproteobacteria bacterium]
MSNSNFEPQRNKKSDDLDSILGDLSGLSELIDDDRSPTVGSVNPQAIPDGALLGDLSLLEESHDEPLTGGGQPMTDDVNVTNWGLDDMDELRAVAGPQALDDDDNIPMLTDTVDFDLPTQFAAAPANTVPLLDERVSAFASQPAIDKDQFLLSELENIASQLSTPLVDNDLDEPIKTDITPTPASMPITEPAMSIDSNEELLLNAMLDLPMSVASTEPLQEVAAPALAAEISTSEFNAEEYQQLMDAIDTELSGNTTPATPPVDSVETQPTEQAAQTTAAAAAAVQASAFTNELHTQLARQIDALLVTAINTLSDRLNQHMAERMEKLLLDAVDDAMPTLMEQLSQGLRTEVQTQVKSQLPSIVNDMLGNLNAK